MFWCDVLFLLPALFKSNCQLACWVSAGAQKKQQWAASVSHPAVVDWLLAGALFKQGASVKIMLRDPLEDDALAFGLESRRTSFPEPVSLIYLQFSSPFVGNMVLQAPELRFLQFRDIRKPFHIPCSNVGLAPFGSVPIPWTRDRQKGSNSFPQNSISLRSEKNVFIQPDPEKRKTLSSRERGKGKVGRKERKREPSRKGKGRKNRRIKTENGIMKYVLTVEQQNDMSV